MKYPRISKFVHHQVICTSKINTTNSYKAHFSQLADIRVTLRLLTLSDPLKEKYSQFIVI